MSSHVFMYVVSRMEVHHSLQSTPQITCQRRLGGLVQVGDGMLNFSGNPQLSEKQKLSFMSYFKWLKVTLYIKHRLRMPSALLELFQGRIFISDTGICGEISHLSIFPWHRREGKWPEVTPAT